MRQWRHREQRTDCRRRLQVRFLEGLPPQGATMPCYLEGLQNSTSKIPILCNWPNAVPGCSRGIGLRSFVARTTPPRPSPPSMSTPRSACPSQLMLVVWYQEACVFMYPKHVCWAVFLPFHCHALFREKLVRTWHTSPTGRTRSLEMMVKAATFSLAMVTSVNHPSNARLL